MLRTSRDSNIFLSLSWQDYTVRGLLGKATDDFCEDGRLVEKSTYGESPQEPRAVGGERLWLPLHLLPLPLPAQPRAGHAALSDSNTLSLGWL